MSVSPNPIPAGATAKLAYIVTADRSKWGKNLYYATPVVNGKSYAPIDIRAFTKEDFSSWTPDEQANGSQPVFDYSTYYFDKIKKGETITAKFSYKNLGGRTFHIYKADSETGDIRYSITAHIILKRLRKARQSQLHSPTRISEDARFIYTRLTQRLET